LRERFKTGAEGAVWAHDAVFGHLNEHAVEAAHDGFVVATTLAL
jgi:hypothetical protein